MVQFTTICPFGISLDTGTHLPPSSPTDSLVVTVRPDSLGEAQAKEAVFQVQQVLQRFGFGSMSIEVYEAEVEPFNSSPTTSNVDQQYTPQTRLENGYVYHTGVPNIGTSISAENPDGTGGASGSLGCWLKITERATHDTVVGPQLMAMTCHHVGSPSMDAVEPITPERPVRMVTPSVGDYHATIAKLNELEVAADYQKQLGNAIQESSYRQDSVAYRHMIQGFPRQIGACILSSGLARICPRSGALLDWAIIKYEDSSSMIPSNDPPPILSRHLYQIGYIDRPSPHHVLAKIGRTTGPTAGVLHGILTVVRTYKTVHFTQSQEVTVIPTLGDELFIRKGDSGALVYSSSSPNRYMVWGGPKEVKPQDTLELEMAFVTPLTSIIADIRGILAQKYPDRAFEVDLL